MTHIATAHASRVLLDCCTAGATLWRNNSGQAWFSRQGPQGVVKVRRPMAVQLQPGDVVIRQGVPVAYGCGEGGADYLGLTPMRVVARRFPIFTAIEAKYGTGRLQPNQCQFMLQVARYNGLAIVARNPTAAAKLVRQVAAGDFDLLGKVHEV